LGKKSNNSKNKKLESTLHQSNIS